MIGGGDPVGTLAQSRPVEARAECSPRQRMPDLDVINTLDSVEALPLIRSEILSSDETFGRHVWQTRRSVDFHHVDQDVVACIG